MHILIGLGVVVALLYYWLVGEWFARVLVFLMLCALFFLLDCIVFAAPDGKFIALLLLPIAGFAAWGIAGIPIYTHQRHSYRVMGARWIDEQERRAAVERSHRSYRRSD